MKGFWFYTYGKIITDPLTGYKLYEKNFFSKNIINSNGFEADHEISAKLIKQNYKVLPFQVDQYICLGTPRDLNVYKFWYSFFK